MRDDVSVMELVRYDPIKGCFVLKSTQQIKYWPGTNTPKSTNNAFTWRDQPSHVLKQLHPNVYKNNTRGTPFTIYSKAQASK
jgi:hypothetical protein